MEYKSIKGFSGWGAFGMLLLFLGGGFFLALIVQVAILFQIMPAGTSLQNMEPALKALMKDPSNTGAMQLSQVLGTLCLFFIPAVLYSWVTNGKNKFWLGFNKYFTWKQVLIGFIIIFLANLVAGPLADLSKYIVGFFPGLNATALRLEQAYNEQLLAMSNLSSWPQYILALFIIAFFPAVFEEVFFRGAMQSLFIRWWKSPWLGIIVTSIIFSFIHGSIYLFLSRFILGLILGIIYYRSKNIWVNIIAHFLNNAIAVTQLFILSRTGKKIDPAAIDPQIPWWAGILGTAAIIGLFLLFDYVSRQKLERINAKEKILVVSQDPFAGIAGNVNPKPWD